MGVVQHRRNVETCDRRLFPSYTPSAAAGSPRSSRTRRTTRGGTSSSWRTQAYGRGYGSRRAPRGSPSARRHGLARCGSCGASGTRAGRRLTAMASDGPSKGRSPRSRGSSERAYALAVGTSCSRRCGSSSPSTICSCDWAPETAAGGRDRGRRETYSARHLAVAICVDMIGPDESAEHFVFSGPYKHWTYGLQHRVWDVSESTED